jgi:predicted nucleic acid-binding protein
MIVFLDSSILIAAVAEIEPHHKACAGLLLGTDSLCIRSHALAESFATLTGGRLGLRVTATEAVQLLTVNILPRVKVVDLTASSALRSLAAAESRGIRGGAVHDYLHLVAARKARARKLYTLNTRHFFAFHRHGDPEIAAP